MKADIQRVLVSGLDARIPELRSAQAGALKPARGWLRAVRSVLGFSQEQVAKKIAMTRQSYADLEASEQRGAISLHSLQRVAEAMDCELVYFLVPRESVGAHLRRTRAAPRPGVQASPSHRTLHDAGKPGGGRSPRPAETMTPDLFDEVKSKPET